MPHARPSCPGSSVPPQRADREWAGAAPEHAEVLLECAAREDEIAELVAELFPIYPELQQAVDEALPAAIAVYYDVFAPYSVLDQLYLQSEAELQGAQAWVGIAAGTHDPPAREVLARCTALEQESAAAVKALLADQGMRSGTPQSGS